MYTEDQAASQGYGGSCYTPMGKEPAYVEGERQRVESFSCTRPFDPESCLHLDRGYELHSNLFPDSYVPGFGDAFSSMWEILREQVAIPMISALEAMLSLPRGFLLQKSVEAESLNMSLLRALRYPPQDQSQLRSSPSVTSSCRRTGLRTAKKVLVPHSGNPPIVEVGISEHTDFEVITIMHQDSPGLWLHSTALQDWYKVPCRPKVFTVIIGDMVECWTSGWLKATRHRVASPGPGELPRKSLVLFQAHDDNVRVQPLKTDQLVDGSSREEVDISTGGEGQPKSNRRLTLRGRRTRPCATTVDQGYTFVESVRHRPLSVLRKYPATTQGAWVSTKELEAKAALLRTPSL